MATNYRSNVELIGELVQPDRVHADVYLSDELFELEKERLFARTWQYVGHVSQVPKAGDYLSLEIAGEPLLMIRQADGPIKVLSNRCAHKGAQVVTQKCGTARNLRCPYHAWTYKIDGTLMARPLRAEYENTGVDQCEGAQRLGEVATADYRGFVFARTSPEGESFETYAGSMLQVLDNLVDRSPEGKLQVVGGCLQSVIRCNWKMYLENVNDAVHAISTHESVTNATKTVWKRQGDQEEKPLAVEQLLPFGLGLDFVRGMGARVLPRGHSILGTKASLHTGYSALGDYEAALARAHGEEKAMAILGFSPQNAILFPSLALKCSPQVLRVVRPLAADRTLIEAWALAPIGAPEELVRRTVTYNRLVYSPMSPVAHDDIHVFEGIQRALHASGNKWISLHRQHRPDEQPGDAEYSATNEILMRNQFRAWAECMAQVEAKELA